MTKDNAPVDVDLLIYMKIFDPQLAVTAVQNYITAATGIAVTTLRAIIGDMVLDDVLAKREYINSTLRAKLDEITDRWGIKVTSVEIKEIKPPREVQEAMIKQMAAERTKRAAILEAEGIRQSEILKAEGEKQAAILKAEGEAEAIKRVAEANKYRLIAEAEGQALAITSVFKAIHEGNPTNDLIAIKYLETLKEVANGQATKIFLPFETTSVLSSLGAIAELFKDVQTKQKKHAEENKEK